MTVYLGLDWSEQKHDGCFIHPNGEVLRYVTIRHSIQGFTQLDQARQGLGLPAAECVVGIETAHNLLVDYLWDQGYSQIYVLPPQAVASAQGRFRNSGAKSDPSDAHLIADLLRTDQARFHLWAPDQPLTRQIRAGVHSLYQLHKDMVRVSNRLRAVLLRYYPAALQGFGSLEARSTLALIAAYPTPQALRDLTWEAFQTFCRTHHHTHPKAWPACYNRLLAAYPTAELGVVAAYAPQAVAWAGILDSLERAYQQGLHRLAPLYLQHPDQPLYASLPGAGALLEPALLGKLGDDRGRFPTPAVLQALAGTCPVTRQSGKSRSVQMRWACDHEFRDIVQQWARLTLEVSPWAQAYYQAVRPRCARDNEAVRRLANRWLAILWKVWQERQPYNQQQHWQRHLLRCTPRPSHQ